MADKEPVADYYPPGATEPQVRPAHVPPPGESAEVKSELETEVDAEQPELKGKLPEDFPGHSALEAEGLTTYAKVRKELAKESPFENVAGIGPATEEKIREAMGASSEEEEEAE